MNGNENLLAPDASVVPVVSGLLGSTCCRQRVGRSRSLSLGFGKKTPHGNSRLVDDYYGEWEIGTFSAAWRVISNGTILCGSQDVVDSLSELDERIEKIQFGQIRSISLASQFDVRVTFDEMYIEFLATASEQDEIFHIFCPQNLCVEYSIAGGWSAGKSDKAR